MANMHILGNTEIDDTNIFLKNLIIEKGVINSTDMTEFSSGTNMLYKNIIFTKNYNKLPTVITATITDRSGTYYGTINTYARTENNKSCDIVMSPPIQDTRLKVGYIVISND